MKVTAAALVAAGSLIMAVSNETHHPGVVTGGPTYCVFVTDKHPVNPPTISYVRQ